MFANTSLPGMDFAFPDVCRTPAPVGMLPIPYPNFSMRPMALPPTTSIKHLIMFMPCHNMATTIPTSNGDNAGVMGGMVSQIMMGPVRNVRCSMKVITGGTPATRMLDNTMHNLSNACGMTLVPGQFKVIYLS